VTPRLLAPLLLAGAAVAAERPNIVLIVADDLGWTDLGCQGSDLYRTPHLDALAARGVRCTAAYSASTVSSPSRAALLTGQAPARLHLTDWIPGLGDQRKALVEPDWTKELPASAPTLAELLRAQGYRTASIGKWHLGGPDAAPERRGFELNIAGCHLGYPPSYFPPYGIAHLTDGPPGEYLTDRLGAEAVRFIEAQRPGRPFFLYLPHYAPHLPMQAPAALVEECRARVKPGARHTNPVYAAMVERVDAACGAVFAALERQGLAGNTLVVFTSDNGGVLDHFGETITSNAPLRGGKATTWEGGVRIPFLAAWPGRIPAGRLDATPSISTDLFPTLLAAAQVAPPAGIPADGRDLLPALTGTGTVERGALYWHFPHYHPYGATPHSAILADGWRLAETFEDGRASLYELAADLGQQRDRAADQPERVQQLRARLAEWRTAMDAQLPSPRH
jgi:arylsulfatase A-like enzyme